MENRKYFFKGHARSDIAKIRQYTINHWGHNQWYNYKTALFKKIQALANNPQIGLNIDEISPDAFRFPIKNHVIYYLRKEDKVIFVGVLSSGMSPEKHLKREKNISNELHF
ncbi:type II toxin-antitoxin system RelE/ParE family toxin [Shewanella frigidimarina]|jgi:toxin ParE1/3/4|uniref:type II toxin-antitoxin system RelE/ParE family toxin n=1 Tax=Shewanella frigidimarina TaxID=56812 RepID=UPI003D792FE0|tara:strand:- start:1100 stop:1432 length:333 start_codon:yes stop_codon:yes gene_type:complete